MKTDILELNFATFNYKRLCARNVLDGRFSLHDPDKALEPCDAFLVLVYGPAHYPDGLNYEIQVKDVGNQVCQGQRAAQNLAATKEEQDIEQNTGG